MEIFTIGQVSASGSGEWRAWGGLEMCNQREMNVCCLLTRWWCVSKEIKSSMGFYFVRARPPFSVCDFDYSEWLWNVCICLAVGRHGGLLFDNFLSFMGFSFVPVKREMYILPEYTEHEYDTKLNMMPDWTHLSFKNALKNMVSNSKIANCTFLLSTIHTLQRVCKISKKLFIFTVYLPY